jgi:hypothetical protein
MFALPVVPLSTGSVLDIVDQTKANARVKQRVGGHRRLLSRRMPRARFLRKIR